MTKSPPFFLLQIRVKGTFITPQNTYIFLFSLFATTHSTYIHRVDRTTSKVFKIGYDMDFISLSRDQALQTLFPHACNSTFMLTNSKDDEAMPNGMRTYG